MDFEKDPQSDIDTVNTALQGSDTAVASVHAAFGATRDLSSLQDESRERAVSELGACAHLAQGLHADLVVVHASFEPIAADEREARLRRACESMALALPEFHRAGVRLAVELLPRTCLGNQVDELLDMISRLDSARAGVCLDVNHLMDRYGEIPRAVRRLGARLFTLHLSDYDGVDEKHWMPGDGVIDWPAFLEALRDIDYQGPFNYEARPVGEDAAARIADLELNFERLVSGTGGTDGSHRPGG
jgi:sugar phosphate isomerase/epimerase